MTRANTKTLAGYTLGDVHFRRPIAEGFSLDVAVHNVLDESSRDFRDYPLPGRSLSAGIVWKGGTR